VCARASECVRMFLCIFNDAFSAAKVIYTVEWEKEILVQLSQKSSGLILILFFNCKVYVA
jgi:hypothetical protein